MKAYMGNVYKIDLRKYFNAKMIGELSLIESGEFQNVGASDTMIVPNSFTLANEAYGEIFDAPEHRIGAYDGLICQGQRIENLSCEGERIYLLGFSEWINSNEVLALEYEDGAVEKCRFTMEQSNYFQKKKKWSGEATKIMHKYIYIEIGECDEAFWFDRYDAGVSISRQAMCVSVCELKEKKQIKSIILPDNELMHLFAVSVV